MNLLMGVRNPLSVFLAQLESPIFIFERSLESSIYP